MAEVLVHAGYTAAEARRHKALIREEKRVAVEADDARAYEDIFAGDYVIIWEEALSEEMLNDDGIVSGYGGMCVTELRCPVVLGVAVEDCDKDAATVNLQRYRQTSGNLNLGFQPGVLRDNSKWMIEVCRESVVMIRPEVLNRKPLRLSSKTKKKLCEVSPVSGMFKFQPRTGIVPIGYSQKK